MDTDTRSPAATRIQRICLAAVAAGVLGGAAWSGPPATATSDPSTGTDRSARPATPGSALDVTAYLAQRKMGEARDRALRTWLYR